MPDNIYDVIIAGAGPIGLTAGIEAAKRNYKYLIIEKGCLVNSIYHYPTNMTFFSTSSPLEIGEVPFVSHGDKPTRREALEYYRRAKQSWELNVNTYEAVLTITGQDGNFIVTTNKGKYFSKKVIIATGFFDKPNYLNIPGEDLPKVKHYFDEAHPYAYLKVIVIGAANSAVDVALETYRRGSEVTMVVREDRIKDNVKYWVKPDIENRIKEGSIKAYFNSSVIEVKDREVKVQTPDGIITLENDFVFAMTGYHSDYDFLSKAGIKLSDNNDRTPLFNPDTFETNVPGIYLAGVVCSGMDTGKWFIENSRYHAVNIFNHIENASNA
jgi:thioredoxin reductase (NADPH)